MENVNVEKLNNPELLEKLKTIEDPHEFREAVEAEGIDLDDALKAVSAEVPSEVEAEVNEEELENVAGGWALTVLKTAVPLIWKGAACLKKNMDWKTGKMKKCDCGLHWMYVK